MVRGVSLTKKKFKVRKFISHCFQDEDLRMRAEIRGRESTTLSFLYRDTDMTAAEICYMFSVSESTFANLRKKNRWKKAGGARIAMSKERLEDLIIRGAHHLIPPKNESELDLRKKYNHIGYVVGLKVDEMLKSNIVNSTELQNLYKLLDASEKAYKLQMNASGYLANTKDIRELEAKHRGLDQKDREMEMKNEGGRFIFDTVAQFDSELGMSKGENLRIVHDLLRSFLGEKDANKITEALDSELGKFMTPDVKEVEYVKEDKLQNGQVPNEPNTPRRRRKTT